MQLQNDFGSQGLVDTLHAYRFCISYDDLRRLVKSAAEEEIKIIKESVYTPTGIIARNEDANLIHEGDENIDINAETIDGKIHFMLCMARVVFQRQSPDTRISFPSFLGGKRKSLQLSDEIVSLTQAESFKKPPKRADPPLYCSPVEKLKSQIKSCTDDEVHDLTRLVLRSLCREIAPLPKSTPFSLWTGYNARTLNI